MKDKILHIKCSILSTLIKQVFFFLFLLCINVTASEKKKSCKFLVSEVTPSIGAHLLHAKNDTLFKSFNLTATSKKFGFESKTPEEKIQLWLDYLQHYNGLASKDKRYFKSLNNYFVKRFVPTFEEVYRASFGDIPSDVTSFLFGARKTTIERRLKMLESSLKEWVEYFTSSDTVEFPTWFKYWVMSSVRSMGRYDVTARKFRKRSNSSVDEFPELNHFVIQQVYDHIQRFLNEAVGVKSSGYKKNLILQNSSFKKIYAKYTNEFIGKHLSRDTTEGKWVEVTSESFEDVLNSLRNKYTGWCIERRDMLENHMLKTQGFYVYYSKDKLGNFTVPRLSVRLMDKNLGVPELSGVGPYQKIDLDMARTAILSQKIKEHTKNEDLYQEALDRERLVQLENKNQLNMDDFKYLYAINSLPFKNENILKRVERLKKKHDARPIIAAIYSVKPEQVSLSVEELFRPDIKVHFGLVSINEQNLAPDQKLRIPSQVVGGVDIIGQKTMENLIFPEKIEGGDLILREVSRFNGIKLPDVSEHLFVFAQKPPEELIIPNVGKTLYLGGVKKMTGIEFRGTINMGIYLLALPGTVSTEGIPSHIKKIVRYIGEDL